MKLLHNDKKLFAQALSMCRDGGNLSAAMVEKDYYVFILLRELMQRIPELVFKGGTSLSKCHKIIDRFSEDVDLSTDVPVSQGRRKQIKNILQEVVKSLGLQIINLDDTRSRRDYNRYIIAYNSVLQSDTELVTNVILEITYISTAVPTLTLVVDSIVGSNMVRESQQFVDEYLLQPVSVKVQSLERTCIDKVFALCDYCMRKEYLRNSRHIYDIHKILPKIEMDEKFRSLIKEVRNVRQQSKVAVSAVDGVDINAVLQNIIDTACFKADYEKITFPLIFEKITYDDAIEALREILKSKVFDDSPDLENKIK